ncbi:patatin-like phospholipase family protein [Phormidium sp. LEGE 05292]|uniref:CBASS cGAMP-activated phospholipase n=1 Tax=[Phormidium] sp. LEGE 05292 TaxID=767427 RepID=UPI0018830F12|nr:CBASS cGAMP-activated phospholipase [Phormidium sp. LEGE 05292]MBE9224883.1 patatin-like phospholipase family protein [Phormidium sp. LEGE 05292]
MSNTIKILSIDGGGIRGIIPAIILAEIEERTEKRVADLFDLIAGTSTGGILALGLTKPNEERKPQYTARDLVDLYKEEGRTIFPSNIFNEIKALIDEKYPSKPLEEVLHKYFGETRLNQALTEVLITSYDLKQRDTFFFKRSNAITKPNRNFKMAEVARATSAAPTYFEPLQLQASDRTYLLVDGGVFANNPAMSAYVEAKTLHQDATKFLVVSIGTGQLTNQLEYKQVKDWGQLQWAQPILNVVFDGVSDAVDYQMNMLLSAENNNTHYYRFQINLQELQQDMGDRMDDASERNINYLEDLARRILNNEEKRLDALCQLLVTNS